VSNLNSHFAIVFVFWWSFRQGQSHLMVGQNKHLHNHFLPQLLPLERTDVDYTQNSTDSKSFQQRGHDKVGEEKIFARRHPTSLDTSSVSSNWHYDWHGSLQVQETQTDVGVLGRVTYWSGHAAAVNAVTQRHERRLRWWWLCQSPIYHQITPIHSAWLMQAIDPIPAGSLYVRNQTRRNFAVTAGIPR